MSEMFTLVGRVRDYECDIQGIVNNSVYQNYLEHARHEFLIEQGVDFAALAAKGINLVVVRAEIDYKMPLRPRDEYSVSVKLNRVSKVRFEFEQEIVKVSDGSRCILAKVYGTSINERGRPSIPEELNAILG